MNVPTRVIDYTFKTGKVLFVISVIALALNYWKVFTINSEEIKNILWGYLLINAFAVSAILYRRYSLKSTPVKCPYCKGELQSKTVYICPNCGELKPEK